MQNSILFTLLASLIVSTLYNYIIFFSVYWGNFDCVHSMNIRKWNKTFVQKFKDVTISVVVNNYNGHIFLYKIKCKFMS